VSAPSIAVVVPSRDRPLRLRWLLNALEEQTLTDFEVIVAHDSTDETEALLRGQPLARRGVLRSLRFPPGPGPAVKRNAGWRAARAPLVAFTDDDCRPPRDWLANAVAAAQRAPDGAVIQGATEPDPDERNLLYRAAHVLTQRVDPPDPWGQTCNIVYPRALLERLGGFDESLPVAAGEDTDLALRARAAGAEIVAAPEVRTYHAVDPITLAEALRQAWRWQHMPYVAARHPEIRREVLLGLFWKPEHAGILLALAGLLLARRFPLAALLVLPWARLRLPPYGSSKRGRLRAAAELPGRAAEDLVGVAALARGSVRHRTLFL
jgi:cellulose synthase/poly-beta-1,6-N-acetylglucosamine synthase-like glycosyltransferase